MDHGVVMTVFLAGKNLKTCTGAPCVLPDTDVIICLYRRVRHGTDKEGNPLLREHHPRENRRDLAPLDRVGGLAEMLLISLYDSGTIQKIYFLRMIVLHTDVRNRAI